MTSRLRHPALAMASVGVSETPAAVAIGILAFLQYVFTAKLWEGYPIRWMGDTIHQNVVSAGIATSLLGACALIVLSLRRWRITTTAARRLEKPASDRSFDTIRLALVYVVAKSMLEASPTLLYTPKNGHALETRQDPPAQGAVVVGLEQRKRPTGDPDAFAGELGHEVSHIELRATRTEIIARRAVALHFFVLAWLLVVLFVVLGFIDKNGIDSEPPHWGFTPIFDWSIYEGLLAQWAVLLMSSAIIFTYSYYALVRREHIHDIRGCQLAGSGALATSIFEPKAASESVFASIGEFFRLHPSASSRARVVKRRDVLLVSPILFPLIVAGSQPLGQLLLAGWRTKFGVEEAAWNMGLTVATGLMLYLTLSADISRLGLGAVVRIRAWALVPLYAVCAGVATQIPRVVIEILYGWRVERPFSEVFSRISSGIVNGGGRTTVMVSVLLILLGYISAVRIAAVGETKSSVIRRCTAIVITICGFAIASMTEIGPAIAAATLITILVLVDSSYSVIAHGCPNCNRRRWAALVLRSHCECGVDRLSDLRRCLVVP